MLKIVLSATPTLTPGTWKRDRHDREGEGGGGGEARAENYARNFNVKCLFVFVAVVVVVVVTVVITALVVVVVAAVMRRQLLIKLKFILIKQASQMSHLRFNDVTDDKQGVASQGGAVKGVTS